MPNSRSSLRTLRAISTLFLSRILKPVAFMTVIVLGSAYVLTILLSVAFSSWWLLLLVILVPLTVIAVVGTVVLRFILRQLLPRRLSPDEKGRINAFLDKLERVAENAKLPYPVLVFLVAKDVIRKKESKFLAEMIGDTKGMMTELGEIERLFRD